MKILGWPGYQVERRETDEERETLKLCGGNEAPRRSFVWGVPGTPDLLPSPSVQASDNHDGPARAPAARVASPLRV